MSFLKFLFSFVKVKKKLNSIDRKIERLKAAKDESDRRVSLALSRLSEVESQYKSEADKTRLALKDAKTINDQLEEALRAVRDELRTANDITIPGLVAANRVFIDRWEAESKIQVLRGTLVTTPKED